MKQRRLSRQAGFSLMEIIVVLAITSALLIMSYTILEDAARTSIFVEVRNDLPVFAQSAINVVQAETFQARTIFDSDPAGMGTPYLGIVNLPPQFPLLKDSKMPLINATSTSDLLPDVAGNPQYTGNCLLMVRQLEPIPVTVPAGSGGGTFLMERYQFEFFYLTQRLTKGFRQQNYYLDLMRGRSPIYADLAQITNQSTLTAAQRTSIYSQLAAYKDPPTQRAIPIIRAWDPGAATTAAAFGDIHTTAPFTTAVPQPTIDMTPTSLNQNYYYTESLLKALRQRISGMAEYSVAFRPSGTTTVSPFGAIPETRYALPNAVPEYAVFDSTKFLFPSGMEFLVVGPAGSRRVLSRLVIMASYGIREITSREVVTITSAR